MKVRDRCPASAHDLGRTGGHFYAFSTGDGVVVKLPQARVAEPVASAEGAPCAPRPGRPMREGVRMQGVSATSAPGSVAHPGRWWLAATGWADCPRSGVPAALSRSEAWSATGRVPSLDL